MRQKRAAALSSAGPRWDKAVTVLFSVFLLFLMHLSTEPFSVAAAFAALALCIGRAPWRLGRERFCVPVLGLLAFMALYGAAAIYSPFGGTAAREFGWALTAFAVSVLVLLRLEKRHIRGLLWGFAAVCGVIGLLCTSSACDGPLFRMFCGLAGFFGVDGVYGGISQVAGRVNGIYNDANVSASILALGTLVSLCLVQTSEDRRQRLAACVLVSVCASGILLSLSRGAVLCFALALLVWLIAAGKGRRLRLFLLMAVSALGTAVFSMLAMSLMSSGSVLPNLLAIAAGGAVFALDWAVGERLTGLFAGHKKALLAAAACFVAAVLAYAVAATQITGAYTMKGAAIDRALSLAPGTYTASGDWDGDIYVNVIARSRLEVLQSRGRYTALYSGFLDGLSFTVTGEEYELTIQLSGEPGCEVRRVVFSDGTELRLGYPLLPESLANRLQGNFFAGNSFLLRLQFDKDAWRIFCQSPLIGRGLGSTDNLYPAVQPFYYTSRYAHNHILQIMANMGLAGLAAFLTFIGGVLWLLVKALRKERDPLAAMLLACWVMMNTHSLMEINFSLQAYQCAAYVLLLAPVILYGEPLSEKGAKSGGAAVCAAAWLYLAAFGGLMGLRQSVQRSSDTLRATSMDQLLNALDGYAKKDVFDPAPYQLEYAATALQEGSGRYDVKMLAYVEKLRTSGSYPGCSGLLEYYYLPAGDFRGLFACSRECLLQRASYEEIWNGQAEFYRTEVLPAAGEENMAEFTEGVLAFQALLTETNQGRMEEIVLTEENQAFISAVCGGASYGELTGRS